MARLRTVQRARASKRPRHCAHCQHEVQIGEAYRYADKKTGPRSGYRVIWCKDHTPRPSELASGRRAELMGLQEGMTEGLQAVDPEPEDWREGMMEIGQALDVDAVQELQGSLDDAAQAIEDGFGHGTAQSEALEQAAAEIGDWGEELEYVRQSVDHADATRDEFEQILDSAWEAVNAMPEPEFTA